MELPALHFVGRNILKRWPDYEEIRESELLRDPDRFKGGDINWVFQTYLRVCEPLRAMGFTVTFGEGLRPDSVNFAHRDSLNRWFKPYWRSYIVGIRADRPPVMMCDWEIVQNKFSADSAHRSYIPLWPQPGLRPRATDRATRLERAAYFGRFGTTSRWLRDPAFAQRLASMGIEFTMPERAWSDYSAIDVVIAHRVESPTMLLQKPASKLINAWLAGVPALMNEEPAFEELRRSPLDYLVIDSEADVIAALEQLKSHPQMYEAMVRNGLERSKEFTVDAIRSAWIDCICQRIVPHAQQVLAASAQHPVFSMTRQLSRIVRQKMLSRSFKWRYARENRARRHAL